MKSVDRNIKEPHTGFEQVIEINPAELARLTGEFS